MSMNCLCIDAVLIGLRSSPSGASGDLGFRWEPWRRAIASASRPARVSRVTSAMLAFKFKIMMVVPISKEGSSKGTSSQLRKERADPGGLKRRAARYRMRLLKAALSVGLMCKAPRTWIEAIVRSASSGETSSAILARPKTWM